MINAFPEYDTQEPVKPKIIRYICRNNRNNISVSQQLSLAYFRIRKSPQTLVPAEYTRAKEYIISSALSHDASHMTCFQATHPDRQFLISPRPPNFNTPLRSPNIYNATERIFPGLARMHSPQRQSLPHHQVIRLLCLRRYPTTPTELHALGRAIQLPYHKTVEVRQPRCSLRNKN